MRMINFELMQAASAMSFFTCAVILQGEKGNQSQQWRQQRRHKIKEAPFRA